MGCGGIKINPNISECTKPLVGIGPMSKNCVDAIYQYSHDKSKPILLIASRRQIDTSKLRHGYVNNWSTEEFSIYLNLLRYKFPSNQVVVCRDHGGPWQGGEWEKSLSLERAMENALTSYYADIDSGFDLLHLDPSIDASGDITLDEITNRLKELFIKCHAYSVKKGRNILYEIGTEETNGKTTDPKNFELFLKSILHFCEENKLPKPTFVVAQTQSLVKEMRQVGNFNISNTPELLRICNKYQVLMKEHNADYLSDYQLSLRKKFGVHAFNVAPEFGVIESKAFLDFCWKEKRSDLIARFIDLSLKSNKWGKWIVDKDYVSEYDKALIAGHYIFATTEFKEMLSTLDAERLNAIIREKIYRRIDFYCT